MISEVLEELKRQIGDVMATQRVTTFRKLLPLLRLTKARTVLKRARLVEGWIIQKDL